MLADGGDVAVVEIEAASPLETRVGLVVAWST
jgi:hypothetical protein